MYRKVATLRDLWSGETRRVVVDGRGILLVSLPGAIRAYADRCAHLGVPLSRGRLAGDILTCSAHGWQYDVRTGEGVNPEGVALRHYPVKVEDGSVLVDVDA